MNHYPRIKLIQTACELIALKLQQHNRDKERFREEEGKECKAESVNKIIKTNEINLFHLNHPPNNDMRFYFCFMLIVLSVPHVVVQLVQDVCPSLSMSEP